MSQDDSKPTVVPEKNLVSHRSTKCPDYIQLRQELQDQYERDNPTKLPDDTIMIRIQFASNIHDVFISQGLTVNELIKQLHVLLFCQCCTPLERLSLQAKDEDLVEGAELILELKDEDGKQTKYVYKSDIKD